MPLQGAPGITKFVPSWYSVTDYGALADGNTDDSAACQAAMKAANDAGGGLVVFPAGNYRLDTALSWTGYTNVCVWLGSGSGFNVPENQFPDATGVGNSVLDFRQTTITGTALGADGLPGTDASSRYVGAMQNGPPYSGTFLAGDFSIDLTGSLWICTTSGTPGTWVQLAGNQYPGEAVTGVGATTPIVSSGGTAPVISLDSTAQIVQTNQVGGTNVTVTGLTGATAGGRIVGATTSGYPLTGSFLAGDLVIDKTGSLWICTVAGTPGTWVQMAGNTIVGSPVTGVAATAPLTSTGGTTPTIALPVTGVIAQTVPITGTALVSSGLTGATAASRYVGATLNGQPISGSFLKGDFSIDQTGSLWICTTSGTPGTWVQMAGNTIVGSPVTGVSGVNPILSSGGTTPSISWNSTYAILQTNTITGTALKPTGLAGATGATRYVGGTASIAPTSGTFAIGDFVVTANAKIYVCTAAGTPGTWTQLGTPAAGGGGSWTTISRYVVTGFATTDVVFAAIPQTYSNLRLEWTGSVNGGSNYAEVSIAINNVGGAVTFYDPRKLEARYQPNLSSTVTWTATNGTNGLTKLLVGNIADGIGQGALDIYGYRMSTGSSEATAHRRFVAQSLCDTPDAQLQIWGQYYGRTTGTGQAITTMTVTLRRADTTIGAWKPGSVLMLYGIL